MSQLNKWMTGGKISKLVVVVTSRETGEHVERWQFDVLTASTLERPPLLTRIGANVQQTGQEGSCTDEHRQGECVATVSHDDQAKPSSACFTSLVETFLKSACYF